MVTERQKLAFTEIEKASGWAHNGVAGVVGNLVGESGTDLNSTVHRLHADHGSGGIAEWRLDRLTKMIAFVKGLGLDENDLGGQCRFLVHEVQTEYPQLDAMLKDASRTVANQAANFCWIFERPNKKLANVDGRIRAADAIAAEMAKAQPVSHVGPSVATAVVIAAGTPGLVMNNTEVAMAVVILLLITLVVRLAVMLFGHTDKQTRFVKALEKYNLAHSELLVAKAALVEQEAATLVLLSGV